MAGTKSGLVGRFGVKMAVAFLPVLVLCLIGRAGYRPDYQSASVDCHAHAGADKATLCPSNPGPAHGDHVSSRVVAADDRLPCIVLSLLRQALGVPRHPIK
jgi:hypothetical protein